MEVIRNTRMKTIIQMKKGKPTFITDLTTEIMNNRDLLNVWAKYSVDMEFLDLSVDILSDLDLLFRWDCDNVLDVKLAGILSGNKDFKLKSGMVITIDESYVFPIESSIYKYAIKVLIDKKANDELIIEDLLSEGYSIKEIKEKERFFKMSNFLEIVSSTQKYSLKSHEHYLKNLLPEAVDRYKKSKKEFFKKKADGFSFYPIENGKPNDDKVKDFTEEVWFIVGCKIATGEMATLRKTYTSATQVAKHLGIEKSRPYISDSIYNLKCNGLQSVSRNTNIYNDPNKIRFIYNYCISNQLIMTDDFVKIYNSIESN